MKDMTALAQQQLQIFCDVATGDVDASNGVRQCKSCSNSQKKKKK
jgi:hypothetical protein